MVSSLSLAARVAASYTTWNLALLAAAIALRDLRAFVVCNTALIAAVTSVVSVSSPDDVRGMLLSMCRSEREAYWCFTLINVGAFVVHVVPLAIVVRWAVEAGGVSIAWALVPPVLLALYVHVVDLNAVYGARFLALLGGEVAPAVAVAYASLLLTTHFVASNRDSKTAAFVIALSLLCIAASFVCVRQPSSDVSADAEAARSILTGPS